MNKTKQKEFFQSSYKTGSDNWTHIPLKDKFLEFTSQLPKGSFVLDLGCGRGLWSFKLAEMGFKVLGVDYASEVVEKANEEVKSKGLDGQVGFVEGDVFDIPFADQGFDAVFDIGLIQHLDPNDWMAYKNETLRVLKPGGLYFNISFSKETVKFLNWTPKAEEKSFFQGENLSYYFFSQEEMVDIFSPELDVIKQELQPVEVGHEKFTLLLTLFKKKKDNENN